MRETLVALDDEHYFKYDFTETHYPVPSYLGKLECTPITASDRTLIEWSATFDAEPGKAAEAEQIDEKQTVFFKEGLAEYVRLFE